MTQERGDFILPKEYGTFEELAKILDVSMVKYGELLSENIPPDRRIALLKELIVDQKNFELAFHAVNEANTTDNQIATNVLQKLALKIQYCDMLAKGSVLKSEVDLKRETLRISNRALKGASKQGAQSLTTGHMQVVASKADFVCTLLNQAVTQEAFNAMVKSNEANESVNLLDSKTPKQESKVLDDTKKLVKKIHKDEEHRADEITIIRKREAKDQREEDKNSAALEAKFSEDPQDLGQEKIKKSVVKVCKTLRGNSKSTSKEHDVFVAMRELSSGLSEMSARIPNFLIDQEEVRLDGVNKDDEKNTTSQKKLNRQVQEFDNNKEPILRAIKEIDPTGHSIEKDYPHLLSQLEGLNVNTHKDGLHAITLLKMQQEVLNNRIAKMSGGNNKPSEEVKKLIKFRDSLNALEIKASSANESRQTHEALTEIIAKHHISEDSKEKPAGILDLDSHWTTCTLAENPGALRMTALEALDSKKTARDNTPMYDLIEQRHAAEIEQALLPAFLNSVSAKTMNSFKTAWDAGIGRSGKNEFVSKFCQAVMEKIEAHPLLGQVNFSQKLDQPNYDIFRDNTDTASFMNKLNSFCDRNNLDDNGRHLKPEVKERFIREMMSEFSQFMTRCGFDEQYLHKHLEAFCDAIEKKIINSVQSGKPIVEFMDFQIVGRGSISDIVAQENRAEMIKLALDQLQPIEIQKIVDEALSNQDISALDSQVGALIREQGVELLHNAVRDHFNLNDKVDERLEYLIQKAWEAKGSLAVQAATHAARENFDINTVEPAVRQAVVHSFSEKSLKEAGLCNHLRPDQSGVNRMCLLLSREVSSASAVLVASTTNELVRRQSAAAEAKQTKAAPLDLSKVTRQRSMSTPQPPSARLQEGPSENKDAIPRSVQVVQREMIISRQEELKSETRPRSQSNAAPVIKKVAGTRPTKKPTQAPPEPPNLPAASWARPQQGQGPKQTQETSQSPKKDDHAQSDNNTKKF